MKLYIKNMVCNRCKMVVKSELIKFGLHPASVELGEVEVAEEVDSQSKSELNEILVPFGFELIDDRKSRIIEKIKTTIVELVHYSDQQLKTNLSRYLSQTLQHDYTYLSNLFSQVTGITIEKYFISQKIEKVKELLIYDELSINEISEKLNYSSAAYLSAQFKTGTGMTPSQFKKLKNKTRSTLDTI
ncbi:MAG: helix-turn-helix transcriptional regulator [Chitinophagales bacterium]|nr:helix-turn-helix transcriptional regulator [Chitinophagales bacterium]